MTRVEPLSLDAPKCELLEAVFDQYRLRGKAFAEFSTEVKRHVQLSLDTGGFEVHMRYIGPDNVAMELFGAECRKRSMQTGQGLLPDRELARITSHRYPEVSWTGKPSYDVITGRCGDLWGTYHRVILPVVLDERPQFACYVSMDRILRLCPSE